jgi:hypothetical protein
VIVLLSVAFALVRHRSAWRSWPLRCLASVAIAAVVAAPLWLPVAAFRDFHDASLLVTTGLTPRETHVDAWRYFWNPAWSWGDRWDGLTVQLDLHAVPTLIAASLLLVAALRHRRETEVRSETIALAFALSCFGAFWFLQTEAAYPIFERVPGLLYLQFSWRLAGFLVIALAIAMALSVAIAWDATRRRSLRLALAIAAGAAAIVSLESHPWWSGIRYGSFSPAELRSALHDDYWAGGEFMPRRERTTTLPPQVELAELIVQDPNRDCTVTAVDDRTRERAVSRFDVHCDGVHEVVLPVFLAPGMELEVVTAGRATPGRPAAYRTRSDPRARIVVDAGSHRVRVRAPSWTSLTATLLRTKEADTAARRGEGAASR